MHVTPCFIFHRRQRCSNRLAIRLCSFIRSFEVTAVDRWTASTLSSSSSVAFLCLVLFSPVGKPLNVSWNVTSCAHRFSMYTENGRGRCMRESVKKKNRSEREYGKFRVDTGRRHLVNASRVFKRQALGNV